MKAFLDACVLFPSIMREMLLGAADFGMYEPLWSDRVLEEWARAAARHGEESVARVEIALLRNRFPKACVDPQEKVMSRLLYALRPGGMMFLGTSESIGVLEPYFERMAERSRLYRKRSSASYDHKALVRFGLPPRGNTVRQRGADKTGGQTIEENELFGRLKKDDDKGITDSPVSADQLGSIINLIKSGDISGNG